MIACIVSWIFIYYFIRLHVVYLLLLLLLVLLSKQILVIDLFQRSFKEYKLIRVCNSSIVLWYNYRGKDFLIDSFGKCFYYHDVGGVSWFKQDAQILNPEITNLYDLIITNDKVKDLSQLGQLHFQKFVHKILWKVGE